MKTTTFTVCAALIGSSVAFAAAKTARATINGIDYAYEVHGKGEPLVLLHGGLMTMDSFAPVLMCQAYKAVAPKVDEFPRLLDAMGDFMRQDYDWSAEVAKLTMPVMLVFGDADMVRPEHIIRFYQLLGGGLKDAGWKREHMPSNRLAIVPDLTHYEAGTDARVYQTVLPFLNGGRK